LCPAREIAEESRGASLPFAPLQLLVPSAAEGRRLNCLCLVGWGFNPAENDAVASLPFAPFHPRELSVARVTNHVSAALKTAALHPNLVALRALALTRTLFVRGKIQIEIRGMGESDGQKGILDCLLPIGF
jgi:hypothetical protein